MVEEQQQPETDHKKVGFFSGAIEFVTEHRTVAIGIFAAIVVLYLLAKMRSSGVSNTGSTSQTDQSGGTGGVAQGQTATLDQIASQLQGIQQTLANNPPISQPTPTSPMQPLIPPSFFGGGSFPHVTGINPPTYVSTFSWGGITYKVNAGAQGRVWGTAPGGQQVLLYIQPGYSGGPALTNSQANHSPIQSYLMLTTGAAPGQDLSHRGITGGAIMVRRSQGIY